MKKITEKLDQMAINIFDFNVAMQERNFAYMSDIYNEMMRFESGDSCGDEYYFTEVMDGYNIEFPVIAQNIIRTFGRAFYYALKTDYILYDKKEDTVDKREENKIFKIYKTGSLEADRIGLTGNRITLTPKAVKTLSLSVGDMVKITILNESFIVEKFEQSL